MRKFLLTLAVLCSTVSGWAGPTDLPEMTTDESNPIWYTIKNVRKQKYATYAGDAKTMTQSATITAASFFYFTGTVADGIATVKIHNYSASNKLCAAYNSWTDTGIDWYIKAQSTGVSICTSTGEWNAWNDARGEGALIENWSASDAGSAWEIEKVTDFSAVIDIPAAKEAAQTDLDNLASVSSIYPTAADAKAEIDAITPENNTLAGLNAAIEAINAVVVKYRNAAYQALAGKYFSIQTPARPDGGYMELSGNQVKGVTSLVSPADIWQFVYNDGTVKVYNPYMNKYLAEPGANSSNIGITDATNAGSYHLNVNANATSTEAKVKLTSNGKSVHMDGSYNLVRWDNGGASEWKLEMITDFSSIITTYKANAVATLNEWATLSVVFDANVIDEAKTAIEAISTTDWATFAKIDAELKKVQDDVATKFFTFCNSDKASASRVDAYLAANMSDKEGHGTKTFSYNSFWRLVPARGISFYMYNAAHNVYLGTPSSNGDLVENVGSAAAYTFEIVNAETGIVELKCSGQTLHLNNHTDGLLSNYDNDDAASRWYIVKYTNLTDEKIAALASLKVAYEAKDHYKNAVIGNGLGQYQGDKDAILPALTQAENILALPLEQQIENETKDIISIVDAINAVELVINQPISGKFYRIKGGVHTSLPNHYITGNTNSDGGRIALKEDGTDASTVYYYADGKLLAYDSGLYFGLNSNHYVFATVDGTKPASEITFAASPREAGAYTIKSADRYVHYKVYGGAAEIDPCQDDVHAEHDWFLEPVTELPLTIHSSGYSTFSAPVDVKIPEGVTAYYAESQDGENVKMLSIDSNIPANTGVVIKGEGTINFTITSGATALENNLLKPVIAAKAVTTEDGNSAFILTTVEGSTGFYPLSKNSNTIKGHKSYLEIPATSSARLNIVWNETVTGIESIEGTEKTQNGEIIYNLAGQKLLKVQKGVNIINGKLIVK